MLTEQQVKETAHMAARRLIVNVLDEWMRGVITPSELRGWAMDKDAIEGVVMEEAPSWDGDEDAEYGEWQKVVLPVVKMATRLIRTAVNAMIKVRQEEDQRHQNALRKRLEEILNAMPLY